MRPRRAAGPGPARVLVHPSETWSIKVKLCRCHKGSETIIQCSKMGFYGIPLRWDTDSFRHSAPPPPEREALARAPLTALPEKQGKPRLPRANRRARGKRKGPAGLAKPFLHCCKDHSALGAPTGHTPAHAPHSMQVSASMTYLPSPSEIALTGHSAAQAPQAMHSSEILYAMVKYTSLLVCLYCNSFGGKKQGLFLKKNQIRGFFCRSLAGNTGKFFLKHILGAAHASLSAAKPWTASEVRRLAAWERALPSPLPRPL